MMYRNTGGLGVLAKAVDPNQMIGGINIHVARGLRGKKKQFLGYGYFPRTEKRGDATYARFPNGQDYLVVEGRYLRILEVGKQTIIGRKDVKAYLKAYRKSAKKTPA